MKIALFLIVPLVLIITINAQTNEKNNSGQITIIPTISVTIGGDFIVTGTFPASINERVDALVTRIFDQAKENMLAKVTDPYLVEQLEKQIAEYPFRDITLKRSSGEVLKIDLLKFRLTGDFKDNPYLRNDDVLIFPQYDPKADFFVISGAVNNPNTYQFSPGDKLSDALLLAQGVNKAYENVHQAKIFRLSYNGEKMNTFKVNLSDDIPLERGDRIIVLAQDNEKKNFYVEVIGEVNMPGKIPITKDKTTIRQVLKQCDWFKDDADISKGELIRGTNAFKSLIFSDQIERLRMLRMSTLLEEDTTYFNVDEMLRLMRGNGLVDFEKVQAGDSAESSFIVRDGDVIYIPPKVDLVYIFGQINSPGYAKYIKGEDYHYYIQQAGGLGETASNDIYLIKGRSRAWFNVEDLNKKNISIEPGDFIWVSKKTPRTFWYEVARASQLATVITAIATIAVLYFQYRKL
ncbi:MAG: SLBB domain-containing protein [Ignavibacteriaceae bacterium]